jgi:hypothetical protein
MLFYGILRRVVLVRIDVSEKRISSIIIITFSAFLLLVTANVPSSLILPILIMKAIGSSETPVLTRATRCHIPEDGVLHSHSREKLT